jgi:hypothetical protein
VYTITASKVINTLVPKAMQVANKGFLSKLPSCAFMAAWVEMAMPDENANKGKWFIGSLLK